jgi:hypothetical protein
VTLDETAYGDLLRRASEARERAEAMPAAWMKELLEHIAQEYERAAERAAILAAQIPSGKGAARGSKTSLFAI